MKTFHLWWTMVLLLVTFNKLQAEINVQITYKYEYLKAFSVTLQNLDNQRHTIYLEDEHGVTLIQETIDHQEQFGRMYNLEELPEGAYIIIVENEQQIIGQPVVINRRFLTINLAEQKEILKPAIQVETDLIAINMLHFEKEAILITLESEHGQTIYTNTFKTFGSLNKQLNISRLTEGQYTLIIQTDRYKVRKRFTKGMPPVLIAGKL